MTTLRIEHPITDYDTWKGAFDRFGDIRHDAGVLAHRIHRPVDDEHYVIIDLDFDSAAQAERFLGILKQRVWAVPESSPALAGAPQTRLLETLERADRGMRARSAALST
ncbi:hypothetical protein [Nocardioides sp. LHG3406-4]|uniref:hypothetical protein n=1 Tax=Nocardioides sp. LHG3406-4 TaxID=2804575 RepID=UPI003CF212D0